MTWYCSGSKPKDINMIGSFPGLKVQTMWVIQKTYPAQGSVPVESRLNDLHTALHSVHGGLYINTKPHTPRFREKTTGAGVTAYLVCFNTRTTREAVVQTVETLGFQAFNEMPQSVVA